MLDCLSLPDAIQQQLVDEGIVLADYPRMVLLGNGGQRLWNALSLADIDSPNPIDDFSTKIAVQFIRDHLEGASSRFLYPGPTRVSLIQLGELSGWSHPSPLGLGIHSEYGLWFAYRAAFVTSAALAPTNPAHVSLHPCESCRDKPCIPVCPVDAVSSQRPFDVSACYEFRLSSNSPCAGRCLARLVCPVGRQHQYSMAQIQHHYDLSRRAV